DRHASLLGLLADQLHVLLAALFGEWRDGHADDLPVVRGVQAHVARAQGLLDGPDLALVVDLDHQQPRLRRADLGELVQRRGRAVVRDHDLVDEGRVGTAGADGREVRAEVVNGLRHLGLGVAEDRIDHVAAPTNVPISSPSTTRSMLPGVSRLKTTIGTLLSMQRVRAVLSITSMPRLSTSRYPRRSNFVAVGSRLGSAVYTPSTFV